MPNINALWQTFENDWPALIPVRPALQRAIDLLVDGHQHDRFILTCGNGGSAADSDHLTTELVKSFLHPRPTEASLRDRLNTIAPDGETANHIADKLQRGIRAISLTQPSALLTAVANDQSPDLVFAQSVYALGRPGDTLITFTTSGNSRNIVRAMQVAKALDMHTICFTGNRTDTAVLPLADILLPSPSAHTPRIQEFHLPMYHLLCAAVEALCFAD